MVRSVHDETLKNAIHDVAQQNAGFLYVRDEATVERINEYYGEREETDQLTVKSSVKQSDIRSKMQSLAEDTHYTAPVREDDVFFVDPFKLPTEESSALKSILERLFRRQRYHTQTSIVDFLQEEDIRIAEDDLSLFVREMKQRDLLEEVGQQTTYYRPGAALTENSNLVDISVVLGRRAGEDGCLTMNDIGNALEIETVDREIRRDLTEQTDALVELDEAFLVNSDSAVQKYVTKSVERGLGREVEEKLRSNDWVMTEEMLDSTIRSQSETLLNAVENESDVFYDLRAELVDAVGLEKSTIEIDESRFVVYEHTTELESLITDEAERIRSDVERQVDNDNPVSMPTAMEEYADFSKYGLDERVDTYVRERVFDAAREAIDADDEINIWATIEGGN